MNEDFKFPHMGWNTIVNKEHPLFEGLAIIHICILFLFSCSNK